MLGRVMTIVWVLIAIVIVGLGYIRLAPSDPTQWHVTPQSDVDKDLKFGVVRVIETGPGGLGQFDAIASASVRTTVLAGSVGEGMVTYVTRSKMMGFPDYTTAQQNGDTLRIFGRLRFGRSDLGVNKQRVERWLGQMQL